MRYAAKRTWPDRPMAWEYQGEAENLEAFALGFASTYGLGLGTEFEVLDKDSDDAALVSFRIASTLPYTLGPIATHAQERERANTPPPPAFAPAAMSFGFYMVKVAVLTLVVMAGIFSILKFLNLTNPAG